jgi:assimilatory nitrate reductase catalytic subunit
MMHAVRTTCPYCGVGCGVVAEVDAASRVRLRGDPDHPANFGELCSKGAALADTIGLEGRLLHPQIRGRRASWDAALDLVVSAFSRSIAEHGPDSVAFYVSGQLLTEDYYVANKLMKGFVGSANIDTNSRLCMASSVAGHRRAFGADTVPGIYEDLELADLVVLVGSNLAWCHPVLHRRIAAARQKRPQMRVVVVDPRATVTADIADLHLPIRADGDVALFAGLLAWLADHDAVDPAYIAAHTTGFEEALAAARTVSMAEILESTGLTADQLTGFFALYGRTPKVVTVFSQGVNQSSRGTDKVNAIINCHLATGRIGKPGAGPFSVTGQPNAMGGREVGALANMLAAHMDIENGGHRDRVKRFWRAPTIAERPGLKAVDMFRAVADGRIKALWIMATNPADSLPEADTVEAALKTCPFVVVSDVMARTDTVRHAHVCLPAAAWGEKSGTVTNSERRISRQRSFLPPPGEARPDWRIVCDVAKRMGFASAFSYASPAEIFAEHAALSGFEIDGARDFDIGALAGMDEQEFDQMQPVQWPCRAAEAPDLAGWRATKRFFADGQFFTPDRKARLIALRPVAVSRADPDYPLVLNTGRVRDHWHTMTRTGKSARLSRHTPEPFVELHPADAARHHVSHGDVARVSTARGSVLLRARLSDGQARGTIFVPMHWNDQFAGKARVGVLVPGRTDPHSGQPAFKNVPARIERFSAALHGLAVLRHRPDSIDADYWALARTENGWCAELAFAKSDRDWAAFASALFDCRPGSDLMTYVDSSSGQQRLACFEGSRLAGALFLAREPLTLSRDWGADQLGEEFTSGRMRAAVLAGRSSDGQADRGALICSCFGIGAKQIAASIGAGCRSLEAIGRRLQAGTNCGSCRPEIQGLIDGYQFQAAE